MNPYRFSGHETFHCRHFWLKKAFDFIDQGKKFKDSEAVVDLGVGKNMVGSMNHWLKAFGLLDDKSLELTTLSNFLFGYKGADLFLENENTFWLLHYQLQKINYSSIYHLAFHQFRKTRVSFDFTALGLSEYLIRQCMINEIPFSENTIRNDVKVFLRSYLPPSRGAKSLEEDLSALFIDLRLIYEVEGLKEKGEQVYRFNYGIHNSLSPYIFLYAILDQFEEKSISFDDVQRTVSDYFLCNQEQTHQLIEALVEKKYLVYNEDGGRKEIQIKTALTKWEILNECYG